MASGWHEGGVEKESEKIQHEVMKVNRKSKHVLDVNVNMNMSKEEVNVFSLNVVMGLFKNRVLHQQS